MSSTATALDNMTLTITQEIQVRAPLDVTFAALLEQLGPGNDKPDGEAMPMKIEPWPGGRWFRDLGDGNGHFWGVVQAIKRPTLLEITGPLFMSYPVVSNLQYRLSESDGGTLIKFHHTALGLIPDDHRQGVGKGWTHINERIRQRAEKARSK
ncbi:MAG TPA: SRPBCC domain-containing protein [Candidatus Acidoferrales bacterium]|nr:SRPBCC domain-containing protein [Candidatus Acidoferrales bacterium]